MKMLWISQNLPFPPKTGVLQRNYNLIKQASGFADVHLVAILKRDILPDFDRALAERELGKLCSKVTVVELPIESSRLLYGWVLLKSLFTRKPFTVNWTKSARLAAAIRQAANADHYDAVYFDSISLAEYRQFTPTSVCVLNHHNVESQLFQRRIQHERNVLKRLYLQMEAAKLRRYEACTIDRFDSNMTVSELDAQRLREIAPAASTAVVANGADLDYFRATTPEGEPGHLLMVGGMNWFPNRDAVLFMIGSIWPRLSAELTGLKLTVVGADPPEDLLALARSDERVNATGFVDDVRPYIERAQIFVCPMRDGGGTRLKILDALSMGKPIVATTMALEGIELESERDVLLADTPEAFVRQVRRVAEDAGLRARLSRNSREFVERTFSWTVAGRNMRDLFEGLVALKATK